MSALVQATLPHSDPRDATEHVRTNGLTTLYVIAPSGIGLPYGSLPRLILIWLATQAVRLKSREILLGDHMIDWLRSLGYRGASGGSGNIDRIREQMTRLQHATIMVSRIDQSEVSSAHIEPIHAAQLYWRRDGVNGASVVQLAEDYYERLLAAPVPVDWRAIEALRQSPLALDMYVWMTYRYSTLWKDTAIPWAAIQAQFGCEYEATSRGQSNFRNDARRALRRISVLCSSWRYVANNPDRLVLRPSPPHVPRRHPLRKEASG